MGQYYLVVNVDKKEFLMPHSFGDGIKLLEFGASGSGTMCGLAILLANSNGRGGGDLDSGSPVVGRWVGDRVIIAGDYSDPWLDPQDLSWEGDAEGPNLFTLADKTYKDISDDVIAAMMDNKWLKQDLEQKIAFRREPLPLAYGEQVKNLVRG